MTRIHVLSLTVMLSVLTITGCTTVKPGYVGIKVNNWGSQKGVQDYPLQTGVMMYNPFTTDVHTYATFQQMVPWTKSSTEGSTNDESLTFASSDRVSINADVAVSVGFLPEKVPHIFVKYRQDAAALLHGRLRNDVRDEFNRAAGAYTTAEIMSSKKGELLDKIKSELNNRLKEDGFVFDSVTFLGDVRIPDNIRHAINQSLEAAQYAQRAQYIVAQREAEAKQAVAVAQGEANAVRIRAEAQADAQRLLQTNTSPAIIELKRIEKWDGHYPQVVTGSNAMPMLSMGSNVQLTGTR